MYGKTPKCDACIPELMEGNEEVLQVFLRVQGQHIMGSSGPVDLNFQSVEFVLNLMGVENKREVFERVHKVYRHILDLQYKEAEHKKALEKASQPKGRFRK